VISTPLDRAPFQGFDPSACELLRDLAHHNSREWFHTHAEDHRRLLLEPACALVVAMAPELRRRVGRGLRAEPRVGGSVLRPGRDARFHRASPYRPYVEAWFWEGEGSSRLNPGYFLRLEPDRAVIGSGIRRLPPPRLVTFRAAVDEPVSGLELAAAIRQLEARSWRLAGPALRRVPAPYGPDHERAELLRRLGLVLESDQLPREVCFGPELVSRLVEAYRQLRPIHRWLLRLWP
jgi:uncharacterized protein (TIGR02453 family)